MMIIISMGDCLVEARPNATGLRVYLAPRTYLGG
jgi:hypothetical protein